MKFLCRSRSKDALACNLVSNNPLLRKALLSLCGSMMLSTSATVLAQQEPRWFQVEVIIFAQDDRTRSDSEAWRKDISLEYPLNWVQLSDTTPPNYTPTDSNDSGPDWRIGGDADGSEYDWEPATDIFPDALNEDSELSDDKQITGSTTDSSSEISSHPSSGSSTQNPAPNTDQTTEESLEKNENGDGVAKDEGLPEAYTKLTKNDFLLEAEARTLSRSRGYRVLFHEAWRFPDTDDREPPVLIQGGETFGPHRELEGTLEVRVSRYIHVQSNLWLTRFAHNFGQDLSEWPPLPTNPIHSYSPASGLNEDALEEFKINSGNHQEMPSDSLNYSGGDIYDAILANPYIPESIVKISDTRRMRSRELHYIDHPQVGILVICEPYELPEKTEPEESLE